MLPFPAFKEEPTRISFPSTILLTPSLYARRTISLKIAHHSIVPNGFRVIVIGGGHVGLVAAHFLSKASTDFVVLEQNKIFDSEPGAATGLSSQALHLMEQLGLSESLKAIGTRVVHREVRTMKGKLCREVGKETIAAR